MNDAPRSRPDDPTLARETPQGDAEGTAHSRAEQETAPPPTLAATSGSVESMPERFGRYRIVKELGHGAMGSVYLAEDTELHRQVALKIPKFAQQEQSELLERFYREARSAATLNHPNICQVHDIGEHEGTRYITMAYVSGPPLSKLVGTPKVRSERTIAKLVRKIAVGLAAAHGKGILHRDLKPGNILLDERNEPVITDFGLARQVEQDADSRLTQDGTLLGTPAYMSPEQVSGDPERMGPASDVYALGVILYELLTGKPPYKGPIMAVIGQIIEGKPKPPSELRSGLDKRLEAICLKMMAHSVDNRYSSATEAATALSHYLEQASTQSQVISPQAGGAQAKLEEHKQHTIELLKQGKFNEAAGRLQKLAGAGGAGAEPYAQWARAELARLKAMPKEAFEKGAGLVAEAIRLLAQQDYAGVIELLEGVPQEYRSAEAAQLLKQAQELKAEADQLNARMNEAVRDGQYEGLRENVLDRLLELEPGNLTARDIYEHLGTYGPGEKMRFDKSGMLLPARGKYWWLDHLARLISQRMTRRTVQRAKAGSRRKGEPIPADEARSEVPVVPIAIGLGVMGLLLLGVVLMLRTPKGTIVVHIDEPNAVVSVDDGKLQFTTTEDDQSIEIELKKGVHTVTVTKDGCAPFTRQLHVRKGQTETIRIDLASAAISETGTVATGGGATKPITRLGRTGSPDTAKPAPAKTPARITEASPLEPGFVSLFDGKTLTGWIPIRLLGPQQDRHQPGGGGWIVRDGELICDGGEPGWLRSNREFGDFVLDLDFKIPAQANSGVLIRCPDHGVPGKSNGMEIQLTGTGGMRQGRRKITATGTTGAIFGAVAPRADVQRGPDEWNTLQVRCQGDDIEIRMNGTLIIEANMQREEKLRNRVRSGYVGLFNWGGNAKGTAFRNIRIKELTKTTDQEPDRGFVSLFDGKTLGGWHAVGDGRWTVENGAVVGRANNEKLYGLLVSDKVFKDFALRLRFKGLSGDGGFYIRTIIEEPDKAHGLQVQVGLPGTGVGGIYESYGRGWIDKPDVEEEARYTKANDWNEMSIDAHGGDVIVHVNGVKTAELKDDSSRSEGHFALQMYSNCVMHVMFKDIEVRQEDSAK